MWVFVYPVGEVIHTEAGGQKGFMVSQSNSDTDSLGRKNVVQVVREAVCLVLVEGSIGPISDLHSVSEMVVPVLSVPD